MTNGEELTKGDLMLIKAALKYTVGNSKRMYLYKDVSRKIDALINALNQKEG